MKKLVTLSTLALVLVVVFSGCMILGLFLPVTQAEVDEAFTLSFGTYVASVLVLGFGGEIDGVTLDEGSGQITLTNVAVSEFDGDSIYSTISGTFVPSDDETEIFADLTFEGGPVVMMTYVITEDFLDDALNAPSASIDVVANYQDFTVTMTD